MKISPTSLSITQLFGTSNEQYVVPAYQRRYSWHERQVWDLIDDIRLLDDRDTHLLGTIVCLADHHAAGLNRLELVDGQQRLTTVSIVLECVRQRLETEGGGEEVAELGRLLSAKPLHGVSLRKVALDSIDASEFGRLVNGDQEMPFQNGELANAFRIVREWIAGQSLQKVGTFLYRLKNQAIIVRLDVGDAKDAFKLFETINNRGLRLSPTDIVKNFLLGNAARFGEDSLKLAREGWARLIRFVDGTDSDAFFRYYLMELLCVRTTAGDVVWQFKSLFMRQVKEAASLPERHLYADQAQSDQEGEAEDADQTAVGAQLPPSTRIRFEVFLSRLVLGARVFGEVALAKTGDARIDRHLHNLQMIRASQTYGFLMHLRLGKCPDKDFRKVLALTESFILRRHVCGERANETEALFARLCGVNPLDPVSETRKEYAKLCPSDEAFEKEFANADFGGNLLDRARYCLGRIELSKHGDHDELQVLGAQDVHVEHIIPQKIKTKRAKDEYGDWVEYLGPRAEELHGDYVSRIGNLTIFSGTLNIGASNNPFKKKKSAYRESAIELTRELLSMTRFKFKQVEERSEALASIAVTLWPRP